MNSKRKGGSFERKVCKALSLWVTGGKSQDVFWRSAMSGGRATVHHRKGTKIRQTGDICAVAPEGHDFTAIWFIECKAVKSIGLTSFLLNNTGKLAKFWKVACDEAAKHRLEPMLIAQSDGNTIVITNQGELDLYGAEPQITGFIHRVDVTLFSDLLGSEYQ